MIYKFSRFENDEVKRYEFSSFEEAKCWVDQEIEKFKIINRVRDETKDRAFIRFKEEMEGVLNAKGQQGARL